MLRRRIEKRSTRWARAFYACVLTTACVYPVVPLAAQQEVETIVDAQLDVEYTFGMKGRFKQGMWTPIHLSITNSGQQPFDGEVIVESTDSNGIPIKFLDDQNQIQISAGETVTLMVYVKVGRLPWSVNAGVYDRTGRLVDQRVFGGDQSGQLSATDFMIMQIGDRLPLRSSSLQEAFTLRPDLVEVSIVSQSADYHQLPDRWYGYEAVDLLVMTTASGELLEDLSEQQQMAIRQWVHQGGRLLLFAGRRGPEIASDGHIFQSLIPGKIEQTTKVWNTSGLEKYANASERLILNLESGSSLALIQPADGLVELQDVQNAQAEHALIVHSARGLGAVTYVAFDPDQEPVASWPATPQFLSRLVRSSHFVDQAESQAGSARMSSHAGFDDLAGQLRLSLDQFENVVSTQFIWVAGLLGLFILVIGPLDYYGLKKIRQMHWTWITFPLVVAGFSVLFIFMLATLKTSPLALNQIEIIDVDISTNTVRGTNYASVYSPVSQAYSFSMSESAKSMPLKNRTSLACWQGLPGAGLGGLGRSSFQTLIDHQYRVHVDQGQISSLPVQHAGTSSIAARWFGNTSLKVDHDFHTDSASGALRGTVVNPFDFDLHDALILFDGRVYPVGRVFAAGEKVDVYDLSTESQGIDNYFTRYQSGSKRHTQRGWSVLDEPIQRVVWQMMFNQEIGGERYTGLLHRYQSYLDTSNLLRLHRAVLVGQAKRGMTEFVCSSAVAEEHLKVHRFYRVVIPDATAGNQRELEQQ